VVAGLLGGAINLLQAQWADEPTPKHWFYFFLLSVAAAYTVPLFLSLTKSNLLENVLTSPIKAGDWFILFAVCLIAAIYARVFLESVSKNLLHETEEAKREAILAVVIGRGSRRTRRAQRLPASLGFGGHVAQCFIWIAP
jgi:YLATT-like protein